MCVTLEEEQIARAAIELVDKNVVERPSMRAVARKLGVAPASLYRYFPSVETLDVRAGLMAAKMLLDSIPISRGRLARDKRFEVDVPLVELFAHHYLRFSMERPALYRLTTPVDMDGRFITGPRGDSLLWHQIRLLISRFTGKPNDSEAAFAFWSLLHGYATVECYHCRLNRGTLRRTPPGVTALLKGLPRADAQTEALPRTDAQAEGTRRVKHRSYDSEIAPAVGTKS